MSLESFVVFSAFLISSITATLAGGGSSGASTSIRSAHKLQELPYSLVFSHTGTVHASLRTIPPEKVGSQDILFCADDGATFYVSYVLALPDAEGGGFCVGVSELSKERVCLPRRFDASPRLLAATPDEVLITVRQEGTLTLSVESDDGSIIALARTTTNDSYFDDGWWLPGASVFCDHSQLDTSVCFNYRTQAEFPLYHPSFLARGVIAEDEAHAFYLVPYDSTLFSRGLDGRPLAELGRRVPIDEQWFTLAPQTLWRSRQTIDRMFTTERRRRPLANAIRSAAVIQDGDARIAFHDADPGGRLVAGLLSEAGHEQAELELDTPELPAGPLRLTSFNDARRRVHVPTNSRHLAVELDEARGLRFLLGTVTVEPVEPPRGLVADAIRYKTRGAPVEVPPGYEACLFHGSLVLRTLREDAAGTCEPGARAYRGDIVQVAAGVTTSVLFCAPDEVALVGSTDRALLLLVRHQNRTVSFLLADAGGVRVVLAHFPMAGRAVVFCSDVEAGIIGFRDVGPPLRNYVLNANLGFAKELLVNVASPLSIREDMVSFLVATDRDTVYEYWQIPFYSHFLTERATPIQLGNPSIVARVPVEAYTLLRLMPSLAALKGFAAADYRAAPAAAAIANITLDRFYEGLVLSSQGFTTPTAPYHALAARRRDDGDVELLELDFSALAALPDAAASATNEAVTMTASCNGYTSLFYYYRAGGGARVQHLVMVEPLAQRITVCVAVGVALFVAAVVAIFAVVFCRRKPPPPLLADEA